MTKIIQRTLLIKFACLWAALLCCFVQAQAQQNSVGVSPVSVDAKVRRGSSYTQTFTLTNNTGTLLRFRCSVGDIWYDEHNQRVTGRAGTLPRSASLWVQFTPAEVVVEPNRSATVKAIVTVPQLAAGGYYTVPVFEALPAEARTGEAQGNTATASIGIRFRGLMMFTTEDASEYNVEIMGGQISPPTASSELGMQLDVSNRSTAHAGVRGAFAILNASGALAGRGTTEEKRYLPGQRNALRAAWAGELPPGTYTCVITLSYNRVGMEPATLAYELPFEVR
jgi:hypothetical protein